MKTRFTVNVSTGSVTRTLGGLAISETMPTLVAGDLTESPLALPGVALVPGEGEPIVISDEGANAGTLGREAWLQWLGTYAGESCIAIP